MLAALKKKSAMHMKMDSEDAATSAAKTGSKDASNSMFDPAKLLRTMRNRIKDIHVKSIGHGEVDSKPTLSLLNVSLIITVEFSNHNFFFLN